METNRLERPPSQWDFDVCTGELFNLATGERRRQKPWPEMVAAISVAAYLATRRCSAGIHLFELLIAWPAWLKAKSLPRLRGMFNVLRWKVNQCAGPTGWGFPVDPKKRQHHVLQWPLVRRTENACRIVQEEAAEALSEAERSLLRGDYPGAFEAARRTLRTCPHSHEAQLIVGTCLFRHQISGDANLKLSTAICLQEVESRLCRAVTVLTKLWEQEDEKDVWESAIRFADRYRLILRDYEDVFRGAEEYIRRAID